MHFWGEIVEIDRFVKIILTVSVIMRRTKIKFSVIILDLKFNSMLLVHTEFLWLMKIKFDAKIDIVNYSH